MCHRPAWKAQRTGRDCSFIQKQLRIPYLTILIKDDTSSATHYALLLSTSSFILKKIGAGRKSTESL